MNITFKYIIFIHTIVLFIPWAFSCPFETSLIKNGCKCQMELICCCKEIDKIPKTLQKNMESLYIQNGQFKEFFGNELRPYGYLNTFNLKNASKLVRLNGQLFDSSKLINIFIDDAKLLKSIDNTISMRQKYKATLKIKNSGLVYFPRIISDGHHMEQTIDFSHNQIEVLSTDCLNSISAHHLILTHNQITTIEDKIMLDASITLLNLSWNPIEHISEHAFSGVSHLRHLDLSNTGIKRLPEFSLKMIKRLSIENNPGLRKLPSIYAMMSLEQLDVTYSYHCCYFQHPDRRKMMSKGELMIIEDLKRMFEDHCSDSTNKVTLPVVDDYDYDDLDDDLSIYHFKPWINRSYHNDNETLIVEKDVHYTCQQYSDEELVKVTKKLMQIKCNPEPNFLNPCEDVLNWSWLRALIWIVWILAVGGNLAVIVTMCNYPVLKQHRVNHLLLTNLAVADLFVGVYLATLTMVDIKTTKFYYNYAVEWQNGIGCKVAGFLAVFGGQLSVAIMALLSFEVWYNTKYIFYGRRFEWRSGAVSLAFVYIIVITLASLPLFDIAGSYSTTSTCLPVRYETRSDQVYIYGILLLDTASFVYIVFNYVSIYTTVASHKSPWTHTQDVAIAKRVVILIGVDFLCWVPITVIGWFSVVTGKALVDVSAAKVLLVLFFPINASLNPFLYVFLTRMFKKDISMLSRKYLWVRRMSDVIRQRSRVNLMNTDISTNRRTKSHSNLANFLFNPHSNVLTSWTNATNRLTDKKGSGSSHSTRLSDLSAVPSSYWRRIIGSNRRRTSTVQTDSELGNPDGLRRESHDSNLTHKTEPGTLSSFYVGTPTSVGDFELQECRPDTSNILDKPKHDGKKPSDYDENETKIN